MENIPKAIKEFNNFKFKQEEIFTKSKWTGDWEENNAVLLICAEYVCGTKKDIEDCHINYNDKYLGSETFNEWLNKYNLECEWWDSCILYVYLNNKSKKLID